MIIKIKAISASWGGNVANYDLEKYHDKANEIDPIFLGCNKLPYDELSGMPLSPEGAWTAMKLRQKNSGHRVKDPFFRIEICPTMEECKGWTMEDWQQCLKDALHHIDQEPQKNKEGKVIGKGTDLANSQWVAALHLDANNYHIHVLANRITENNKCQSSYNDFIRAKNAANAMAEERGWIKAEDVDNQREKRIHNDAINILYHMDTFSLDNYFALMRAKGWMIQVNSNKHSYKIGETLYKPNGEKSSDIWISPSDIKRDITITNLPRTWAKLHKSKQAQKPITPSEQVTPKVVTTAVVTPKNDHAEARPKTPVWSCSDCAKAQNWWDDKGTARIPDRAYNVIGSEIPTINKMDYRDPDDEIPVKADVVAVAIFEFLVAADTRVPSGGGGGTSSDLRWDGLTEDDLKRMAKGAAHTAINKCLTGLRKRGISL